MDVIDRQAAGEDTQCPVMPPTAEPDVVRCAQIIQAALFFLEAGAIAVVLAGLAGTIVFALLAQITKYLSIEQGGDVLNIALWGLVVAAGFATLFTAFIAYFRLLAHPIGGRIVCALGSVMWALPAGLMTPTLLHVLPLGARIISTWIVFLAVAAALYWLKRRIIRM